MNKFLLIIGAALLMISCGGGKSLQKVLIENPSQFDRQNEIVEIQLEDCLLEEITSDNGSIIVVDHNNNKIPYQFITNGESTPSSIIFPVSIEASKSRTFFIQKGESYEIEPMVYGRLVPERKDDFTWENNRVAYRVYGPALQETGEISNGLDIWVKSVEKMVIDKWYKDDLAGIASYHRDHGEGVDFYKVGPTLGLGMTAPVHDDKLCLGKNFVSSEILDQGPLRITMKFKYTSYKVGDSEVTETRIISLDAYSYLNKVVKVFESDLDELTLATGLLTSGDGTEPTFGDQENGIIAYEVPADKNNGNIYAGAINPLGYSEVKPLDNHYSGINTFTSGNEYLYYTGGGWSKHGFTEGFEQWTDYLKNQRERLKNPLKIKVK